MCHTLQMDATAVLGAQGRLVIPAEVRAVLDLAPGDVLHLHVSDGRLVVTTADHAVKALKQLGAGIPAHRSLVEELFAQRRAEAARE